MIPRDRWGTRGRHRSPVSPGSPRTAHARLDLAPSFVGERSVQVTTRHQGSTTTTAASRSRGNDSTPCFFGALLLCRLQFALIRDSVHPAYLRLGSIRGLWQDPFGLGAAAISVDLPWLKPGLGIPAEPPDARAWPGWGLALADGNLAEGLFRQVPVPAIHRRQTSAGNPWSWPATE